MSTVSRRISGGKNRASLMIAVSVRDYIINRLLSKENLLGVGSRWQH